MQKNTMKMLRFSLICMAWVFASQLLRAEMADGIKAVVNDSVITYSQVEEYTAPAAESLRRQYANEPQAFQQKLNAALEDSLEQLVERQLILRSFIVDGYQLPETVVDQLVQERIRGKFGDDRITFIKTLQAQGMTAEQFRKDVRDQYIVQALRQKNVSSEIVVSPYKIETYYLSHTNDFQIEDEIKLRMIVLNKTSPDDTNTVHRADEILAQIKKGAAFSEMASIYSDGSQKSQCGDWGWVERSVLRKELAATAFTLKPGEVSGVIDTPASIYLMLVEQTRPAHIKPLDDVREEIEKTLRTQQQAKLEKDWMDGLKKKTYYRFF